MEVDDEDGTVLFKAVVVVVVVDDDDDVNDESNVPDPLEGESRRILESLEGVSLSISLPLVITIFPLEVPLVIPLVPLLLARPLRVLCSPELRCFLRGPGLGHGEELLLQVIEGLEEVAEEEE